MDPHLTLYASEEMRDLLGPGPHTLQLWMDATTQEEG